MLKNKQLLIAIVVLVVVALAGGAYVFLGKSSKPAAQSQPGVSEEVVPTIAPSDIGLTMTARDDKKAVKFTIANAKDITGVDYELSYTAAGNIPRGAIGHLDPTAGSSSIESEYIDLGTCSSGHCKYDEGVTSVKLVLKLTKTDGKVYQAETSLDL